MEEEDKTALLRLASLWRLAAVVAASKVAEKGPAIDWLITIDVLYMHVIGELMGNL